MSTKFLLILTYILFCTNSLFSFTFKILSDSTLQNPKKKIRTYETQRLTTEKPIIDGKLFDACWQTGIWAGDYTQWIPNEGAKPSQKTELKILYDEKNIYVAIRAYDNKPDKISIRAGRRDQFNGDVVGLSFDSYHDHRTAFEFNITAAGQKIDLLLSNPTNWDVSWNAVWKGKAGLEDSAWTAEYEIPLSQLRFSDEKEQVWGLHCWRWIDRLKEESDWEPQSSTGPGILYQFGELHGLNNLSNTTPIEILPYFSGELQTFKKEKNNPYKKDGNKWLGNFGLDAKIGLSSNFTVDLSINPDFGQVEADPSVMNLSAFETFYDEKRPFFLEGKNIFNFDFDGSSLFYSRRIGHSPSYYPDLNNSEYLDYPNNTTILSAIKLSGKSADGLAAGVLQSLAANENAKLSESGNEREVEVEPLTNYFLLRLQKDYDEGNTVLGGLITSTNRFIDDSHLEFLKNNAYSGGIDFLYHWNDKEYFIDAKFVGSYVEGSKESIVNLQNSSARYFQRKDANHLKFDENITSLPGYGGSVKIGKGSGGLWRYSTDISWRSPGLELNDIGYINIVDLIKQNNSISYFVNKPVSIFRTFSIGFSQMNNWDFGLNHLSSGFDLNLYFNFINKWTLSTSLEYISENLDTRILRGGSAMLLPPEWSGFFYASTDNSERLYFDISSHYLIAENNRYEKFYFEPKISFIPLTTFKISFSLNFSKNKDDLQYVNSKQFNGDDKYILGRVIQRNYGATLRLDYNITPEISIQYYGSPFVSIGKYSDFKVTVDPKASKYEDRIESLVTSSIDNDYEVVNPINNQTEYNFSNPDFNFLEFRSNFVIRWEYQAGSQIYFVWSQDRNNFITPGDKSINDAINGLTEIHPSNIFLVKFNYWLDI